ncbi:Vesicular glutamate transporter 2 [Frankliniella fusca]|uniref:Vesicular glutamate transporter 2 n=1 Tax=Frankliniella fusca TaxID=407009 RepID=A0AAE1HV24_9NEOP|nr:Vesicular glutamate transporter 2 [Frankliniella fusca]
MSLETDTDTSSRPRPRHLRRAQHEPVTTSTTTTTKCMTARRVLWWLVFFGFAVNYMVRININIAIVGMVRHPRSRGGKASDECLAVSSKDGDALNETVANASLVLAGVLGTEQAEPVEEWTRFDWDERQQGLVLGAFFWLHWLTQLPGGILARRFGTKLVFGLSNAVPGLMAALIPAASHWDYRALLALRLVQGIIAGFCWPSMHFMTAQWIPPNERSKFVTAYMGSSVGAALTFPLCGALVQTLGWPTVFYGCALVTALWLTAWTLLVFDSPAKHPRIAPEERRAIEKAIGDLVSSSRKQRTPWRSMLLSGPVWINVAAQWGGIWALFTLLTQAPTYFSNVHHWGAGMSGLLSGVPHLCRTVVATVVSHVGDNLLKKGVISRTTLRKIAAAICNIGMGMFVLGLAWSGCNALSAAICLTIATALHGAVSTGPLASIVDISPNFASIVLGICACITAMPGFISPYIVGQLTLGNQSTEQWKKVFLISGLMSIGAGLLYVILADSEVQPWNNPELKIPDQEKEMQALNKKDTKKEENCPEYWIYVWW